MLKSLPLVVAYLCLLTANAQDIALSVQTGHSATINKLGFSPDGRLLASAGSDNAVVVWDVNTGKQLMVLSGHGRKVNDLSFHPDRPELVTCSDDGVVITWNFEAGTEHRRMQFDGPVKAVAFSPDGSRLAIGGASLHIVESASGSRIELPQKPRPVFSAISFSPDGKLLAFGEAGNGNVYVIRTTDHVLIDRFSLKVAHLSFSSDSRYLLGAGIKGKLRRWDLQRGGMFSTFSATSDRIWQSYNGAAIGEKYFFGGNRNNLISVFSMTSGKRIKVLNGHSQDVNALALSRDQKVLVSAGEERKIIFWDTETWQIIKVLQGSTNKINDIAFVDDGAALLLAYGDGSFRYWHTSPGGSMVYNALAPSPLKRFLRWEYTITDIGSIQGSQVQLSAWRLKSKKRDNDRFKAKGYRVTWDVAKNEYEVRKGRTRRNVRYEELLNNKNLEAVAGKVRAQVDETSKLVISGGSDNVSVSVPHGHTDRVTAVSVSEQKNVVATAGFDGLVRLHDVATGKMVATLLATRDRDFIYITPENHYFSTKGALADIGFRIGSQVYSFEQFDIKYNRPDIVLEKLRHADTTVTFAYRKAYEKRVRRSGLSPDALTRFDDIPSVEVTKRDVSAVSRTKKYHFTVSGKPASTPLDRLFVSVNGVPVYPRGLPVSKTQFTHGVDLELSNGVNRVMYYVTNANAVSSLKHSFQVTHRSAQEKPVLYLVAIGASQYSESRYNLRYAAKDAGDIEKLFVGSGRFSAVRKVTLLDEDVTRENILALSDFLGEASVDDVVLITYAGHGLLDQNLDYYLSTYNISFENPAQNGLAFAEVEQLLEGIKSRNKVMMIDACHSGEIDKEELEITAQSASMDAGNISFRAVGPGVRNKNGRGLRTSLELSKTLFADIRSSHGAVIISSAGGGEYAIEGKEWNNGIFTYCFINGLKSKKSDVNRDGRITVLELQQYLSTEVPRLTEGKQTPTSREENINNNFEIW